VGAVKAFLATSRTPTLQYMYERTMQEIENGPSNDAQLAKKALAWITFAKRPLKRIELQTGLAVLPGRSKLDERDIIPIEIIISICAGLIELDEPSGELRHAHLSVRTYLIETHQKWFPDAEVNIAMDCLTYLSFSAFSTGYCTSDDEFEVRTDTHGLYEYASWYWGEHFRSGPVKYERDTLAFLMNKNKAEAAAQAMQISREMRSHPNYSQQGIRQMTGLHLAAHFGLTSVVKSLLEWGHDPIPRDSHNRTPLWIATSETHEEIMKILIKRDRTTSRLMTQATDKTLLKALIKVACQDIRDYRKRTPLHSAVIQSDMDIVDAAVNSGAGIDAKDNDGATALMLAVKPPKPSIINKLLQKGADTTGITSEDWIRVYGSPGTNINIVELREDSEGKVVQLLTLKKLQHAILNPVENQRRLL
jgi:hypothetical protein